MRWLMLAVCVLLFVGCRRARAEPAAPAPAAEPSMLALPVLAPMQARERLLHDLAREQQLARERAATFDEAARRDH